MLAQLSSVPTPVGRWGARPRGSPAMWPDRSRIPTACDWATVAWHPAGQVPGSVLPTELQRGYPRTAPGSGRSPFPVRAQGPHARGHSLPRFKHLGQMPVRTSTKGQELYEPVSLCLFEAVTLSLQEPISRNILVGAGMFWRVPERTLGVCQKEVQEGRDRHGSDRRPKAHSDQERDSGGHTQCLWTPRHCPTQNGGGVSVYGHQPHHRNKVETGSQQPCVWNRVEGVPLGGVWPSQWDMP